MNSEVLAMECQKKRRNGAPCAAHALAGKKHCALHAAPSKAAELGSRGGRRRTGYRQDSLKEFAAPKTGADVRDLLAESIVELRAGKLDPKVANALGYLGTSLLRALEIADIEQRLGALEGHQEIHEHNIFQPNEPSEDGI